MEENKIQKTFIEILPKQKNKNGKESIIWNKCNGYNVYFEYLELKGFIKIINYNSKTKNLTVEYNDKIYKINNNIFAKGSIGRIIGIRTSEFKIKKGKRFKDYKRDITITYMKIRPKYNKDGSLKQNEKWYKYTCNACGWTEGWIEESHLLGKRKDGCSCCSGKPILGMNTIWDTDRWMHDLGVSEEDAKTHTRSSHDKIEVICPYCGKSKNINISKIYTRHSIACHCSDNIPFGEKVMFNVLEQLGIDFQVQLTKTNFNWCKDYKYDFYFKYNNEEYILEVNGRQHYEDAWDKLEVTQANDKFKKELALANGVKEENYIVIDCRESTLKWVKGKILESRLNELFDLSSIDWIKIEEFAVSNLVKIACEIKRNNPELTTTEIGKLIGYSRYSIHKWLKIGNKLNWCKYDANEEKKKANMKIGVRVSKRVECIELELIFDSLSKCSRYFEEKLGMQLYSNYIGMVCANKVKNYKGYTFKYTSDLTEEELKHIQKQ